MIQDVLHRRFGFTQFRPKQEAICQAVTDGHDALVVMPTGAGKSLCYQVPGLARGGTTLVISPLVALIEDQVQALLHRGIRAGRIHSGRAREDSRDTFRAYLKGELEFLFIAPERLAVPGFSEMLHKHPPTLIAIDEAHCISQWGHDFRPDYRLVGERLQGLPRIPMIALTATATDRVQADICTQLKLRQPKLFIHGFRRENLAIRLIESLPSERTGKMMETLLEADRLPAIVYAPTRKKSEEIAGALGGKLRAAAYHAGMEATERESVQARFLEGSLDVIVATIAFGMGIDKRNVRTVVHAALPSSLEGYYQEIGRAGRDGLPSVALLLHGFSDRKTHEFFLDQDELDETQRKYRMDQLNAIQEYTRGFDCRMLQLIRHFGDLADGLKKCGICDRCAPVGDHRVMDELERETAALVLASLHGQGGQAVGRLFTEAGTALPKVTRSGFERVLSALARANLIEMENAEFEKGGETIAFRRVHLLPAGRKIQGPDLAMIEIDGAAMGAPRGGSSSRTRTRKPSATVRPSSLEATGNPRLFEELRTWRREEARKRGVPAFRILSDRVLLEICDSLPGSEQELLSVPGIGPKIVAQYGADLLARTRPDH